MRQRPSQQFRISRRQQETRAGELRCSTDQRLEVFIRPCDRMREESDVRGIGRDLAKALDDCRRSIGDSVHQFSLPIVSVDAQAECIARIKISVGGGPYVTAGLLQFQWRPL